LKVNLDEIPLVLSEFIENALRYIKGESKSEPPMKLILLQKAHGIMNVINLDGCPRDQYFGLVVFVNMAVCYQKLGQLEECSVALENALDFIEGYGSLTE
jgi:hypothetical protein